jgi:hypothetical protein
VPGHESTAPALPGPGATGAGPSPLLAAALHNQPAAHRLLEAARRERLLDAVARAVEQLGGRFEVGYVTLALFARRRA